jgi:hypothetical protein
VNIGPSLYSNAEGRISQLAFFSIFVSFQKKMSIRVVVRFQRVVVILKSIDNSSEELHNFSLPVPKDEPVVSIQS